jgi:hypothetical protein
VQTDSLEARNFTILPANASLSHFANGMQVVPNAEGSTDGITTYYVEMVFPSATLDGAFWTELPPAGDDPLPVVIRVRDVRYAFLMDFSENVSRNSTSRLNVTLAGATVATVAFSDPSSLSAWSSQDMGLKASIGFAQPSFVQANDVISVVSATNRTGMVRVAG